MFLIGMAPLGLGCGGSKGEGDGGDTGDTGDTSGTGGTASTSASGTGSTTGGGSSTTDDGGSTTTDGGGGLCDDYAAAYGNCYDPAYTDYVLEWCEYQQAFYQSYSSPACLAAWEATLECRTSAECFYNYVECEALINEQIQICYYGGGLYDGCDLIGQLVGGCINPNAGANAKLECDQTYENLYSNFGGWCGDAFMQMMVCISNLDCLALSDKQYVFDNCGPEILEKKQACQ